MPEDFVLNKHEGIYKFPPNYHEITSDFKSNDQGGTFMYNQGQLYTSST